MVRAVPYLFALDVSTIEFVKYNLIAEIDDNLQSRTTIAHLTAMPQHFGLTRKVRPCCLS